MTCHCEYRPHRCAEIEEEERQMDCNPEQDLYGKDVQESLDWQDRLLSAAVCRDSDRERGQGM